MTRKVVCNAPADKQKDDNKMKKELHPALPQTWATLQTQTEEKTPAATIIAAVALALVAFTCIGVDQYNDARWNAEYQQQCDIKGC